MKRLLYIVTMAIMAVGAAAEEQLSPEKVSAAMTLDSLYELSNRMEHSEFVAEALRHDSLLKATSSAEWMRRLQVSNADTLMLRCMPTLYDIVLSNRISYAYGEKRDSLVMEWVDYHTNDTNILARAYAYYTCYASWKYQQYYDSLPDGWERGILLTDPYLYRNKQLLPVLEDYVSKYPESPFAETIRYQIDRILQMEVDLSAQDYFTSADSIRVDYTITNAHKAVVYLRRAGIITRPIDSCVVSIPTEERLFKRGNLHLSFAPQKPGRYMIYAVLPEDTLRTKRIIPSLHIKVSDLTLFTYSEPSDAKQRAASHAIVTHSLTGEPVRGAMVRGTRYGGRFSPRFRRLTDRDGHAAIRHKDLSSVAAYAKKNRHRSMTVWGSFSTPSGTAYLQTYPNATIFRPGDTLRLAVVGTWVEQDERSLMPGDTLFVQIRSPKHKEVLDTVLVTDAYGEANLVFPIARGSVLGYYNVSINNYTPNRNDDRDAETRCWFRVEDYRLPTFSLKLHHDEGQLLHAGDSAFAVTGSARLFSGLPMAGQTVTATVNYQGFENTITFACATRLDGSFVCSLPDSLLRVLKPGEHVYLRVQMTASDGETHEDTRYIWVENEEPKTEISSKPIRVEEPWPSDQLLWLPKDSLRYTSDGKQVEVLIGTRQANPTYVLTSSRKQFRSAEWQTLPVGANRLTFDLPTDTNDYLDIHVITTVHGVVHSRQVHAVAPLRQELHITPVSFRDYLRPGLEETWRWQLSNQQGEPVPGRFLLTMLDEAVQSLSSVYYPSLPKCWARPFTQVFVPYRNSSNRYYTSILPKRNLYQLKALPLYEPYRSFDAVFFEEEVNYAVPQTALMKNMEMRAPVEVLGGAIETSTSSFSRETNDSSSSSKTSISSESSGTSSLDAIQMREGDTRLAFFLPVLESDSAGVLRHTFRAPLDNTRWCLKGMAWSKNGASCTIDTILTARRTLMAHLTVPRFLRQGDKVVLPCTVRNTADSLQHARVAADLLLPGTDSVLYSILTDTCIAAQGELLLLLPCQTTTATDSLVARVRVLGRDGSSDGEQRMLPVLSVIEPVHEGVPFYLHPGDTTAAISLPRLSKGATNASLILTYCSNPLAYLFGGLPTAVDTTCVTSLQMAHHLFTLSVGNRLAATYPGYRDTVNTASLIRSLRRFQRTNGGFSWLSDSRSSASTYITLEVAYLLGELQAVGALSAELQRMSERALHYLDRTYSDRIEEAEKAAKKNKQTVHYADYSEYAYVRSYFPAVAFAGNAEKHYHHILEDMPKQSNLVSAPYQALCLERAGRHKEALHLITYLRKRATTSGDLGMYFNNLPKYHLWFSVAEQQATYLRAFAAIDPKAAEIEALRQWLLLSRQTTHWGESSLSAYAASALLLSGEEWLLPTSDAANQQGLTIDTISLTDHYESARYSIRDGRVVIRRDGNTRPAWGSATLCYQASLAGIRPYQQKAIKINRSYTLVRGDKEQAIQDTTVLEKGDIVRVTLTLTTDREMDGLVLCDHKPATLEPTESRSGYHWHPLSNTARVGFWSGVLTYRQYRDEEVCIYIEHLPRGTFEQTYDCYVTTTGTTMSGLATAVSELAPEFDAHTSVHSFTVR